MFEMFKMPSFYTDTSMV